jgi:hypothetical protein
MQQIYVETMRTITVVTVELIRAADSEEESRRTATKHEVRNREKQDVITCLRKPSNTSHSARTETTSITINCPNTGIDVNPARTAQ